MRHYVYVTSINRTEFGSTIVEASNGGKFGPPFIRFTIPADKAISCHIGKRYRITIEEQ